MSINQRMVRGYYPELVIIDDIVLPKIGDAKFDCASAQDPGVNPGISTNCAFEINNDNGIMDSNNYEFNIDYPMRKGFQMREIMRSLIKVYFSFGLPAFKLEYFKPKRALDRIIWAESCRKAVSVGKHRIDLVPVLKISTVLCNRFIPDEVVKLVLFHEFTHIMLNDYRQKHSKEFESHLQKFSMKEIAEDWIKDNLLLILRIQIEMADIPIKYLKLEPHKPISEGESAHGG